MKEVTLLLNEKQVQALNRLLDTGLWETASMRWPCGAWTARSRIFAGRESGHGEESR
jgi:hypothetical protein